MDAFIGEIRIFPFTYSPSGWLPCDGTLYNLQSYQALYSIIGNLYGGQASQSTFAVPNFNAGNAANIPVGMGTAVTGTPYVLAKPGGVAQVTLMPSQMPYHNHTFSISNNPKPLQSLNVPSNTTYLTRPYVLAEKASGLAFNNLTPTQTLNNNAIGPYIGGGGAHSNLMPFVAMGFYINYNGDYPVWD